MPKNILIGFEMAEKKSEQTNRQTDNFVFIEITTYNSPDKEEMNRWRSLEAP